MARLSALRSSRWVKSVSALLLVIAAGCTEPLATAAVPVVAPPLPPDQARVWFYRPYEPSEGFNLALINMNDSYVGALANGSAFYRDVPPGQYHIAPQSYGRDINQDGTVDLAPGQQLYVKIVSLRSWVEGNRIFERDTFYVRVIPQETALAEIARNRAGI